MPLLIASVLWRLFDRHRSVNHLRRVEQGQEKTIIGRLLRFGMQHPSRGPYGDGEQIAQNLFRQFYVRRVPVGQFIPVFFLDEKVAGILDHEKRSVFFDKTDSQAESDSLIVVIALDRKRNIERYFVGIRGLEKRGELLDRNGSQSASNLGGCHIHFVFAVCDRATSSKRCTLLVAEPGISYQGLRSSRY